MRPISDTITIPRIGKSLKLGKPPRAWGRRSQGRGRSCHKPCLHGLRINIERMSRSDQGWNGGTKSRGGDWGRYFRVSICSDTFIELRNGKVDISQRGKKLGNLIGKTVGNRISGVKTNATAMLCLSPTKSFRHKHSLEREGFRIRVREAKREIPQRRESDVVHLRTCADLQSAFRGPFHPFHTREKKFFLRNTPEEGGEDVGSRCWPVTVQAKGIGQRERNLQRATGGCRNTTHHYLNGKGS